MNLFCRIFNRFYCVQPTSSKAQLTLDFGGFPPIPLSCDSLSGEWNLVRPRGMGLVYRDFRFFTALFAAARSGKGYLADRALSDDDLWGTICEAAAGLSRFPRLKVAIFWLAPILMTLRLYLFNKPLPKNRDGVGGYFNPFLPNEIALTNFGGKLSDEAVVSHEHIHLLQHRDGDRTGQALKSPRRYVSDKALAVPQMLYFFERREVEARLHECVLSCYRAWGRLPLSVTEFLSLLASSERLGWLVTGILSEHPAPQVLPKRTYFEREGEFSVQLEICLLSMRTPELEHRFLTEVLPVMYGNLLRYYGDNAASEEFLGQLARPSLYDELYGVLEKAA